MSRQSIAHDRCLLGVPGSRERIDTPALVLDLDAFDANVRAMAALARAARHRACGRTRRPTNRRPSPARQLEAGAIGLCCAKLGEAEALADAGIAGLLITSAMPGRAKIERLTASARRVPDIAVVVEEIANVRDLGAAAALRRAARRADRRRCRHAPLRRDLA